MIEALVLGSPLIHVGLRRVSILRLQALETREHREQPINSVTTELVGSVIATLEKRDGPPHSC